MIDPLGDRETHAGAQAQELALQYAAIARGQLVEASERIKGYVSREPLRALGIALGVGVLIGWLTKRR